MSIGGIPHHGIGPVMVSQVYEPGTSRRTATFRKVIMEYTTINACRSCASTKLTYLFSLGDQHVSDFVPQDRIFAGPKVPIELVLCEECGLVQQPHTLPAELLYRRNYWYRSGTTETMKASLGDVVKSACASVELEPGDVVLDIGSNDGTLLRMYDAHVPGLVKVGVEPAENLREAGSNGVDCLIPEFWSAESYERAVQTLTGNQKENIGGTAGEEKT